MSFAIAAALAALVQTAPATEGPAPAAAAETIAKFNLDTPIETMVADAKAKAVLDANMPGMTTHPSYDMFKGMSLRQVQPMSNGQLTDEMIAKTEADLAAIE